MPDRSSGSGTASADDAVADALSEWYEHHYSAVTATANGSFFERRLHRALERPFGQDRHFDRVLELGGNRGEHLRYVRHSFGRYYLTDLRLPALPGSAGDGRACNGRIQLARCDAEALPFADGAFDRVVTTCLLHHLPQPFRALSEMRRVTAVGGALSLLLPTDPGFAYRAGKSLTSGRAARRRGIARQFRLVNAIEHRNHIGSLLTLARFAFREDTIEIDWHPWRFPSWNLNAFVVITVARA